MSAAGSPWDLAHPHCQIWLSWGGSLGRAPGAAPTRPVLGHHGCRRAGLPGGGDRAGSLASWGKGAHGVMLCSSPATRPRGACVHGLHGSNMCRAPPLLRLRTGRHGMLARDSSPQSLPMRDCSRAVCATRTFSGSSTSSQSRPRAGCGHCPHFPVRGIRVSGLVLGEPVTGLGLAPKGSMLESA